MPKKTYVRREFRPMAGYFLLWVIIFIGIIIILKPADYDSLAERILWGFITFYVAISIRRHWPAMKALLDAKNGGRSGK